MWCSWRCPLGGLELVPPVFGPRRLPSSLPPASCPHPGYRAGASSWRVTPSGACGPTVGGMHLRATMGRHREGLIAVILAVGYAVELLLYPGSDLAIALLLALCAGLALALRRRAPLAIFLVVSI